MASFSRAYLASAPVAPGSVVRDAHAPLDNVAELHAELARPSNTFDHFHDVHNRDNNSSSLLSASYSGRVTSQQEEEKQSKGKFYNF